MRSNRKKNRAKDEKFDKHQREKLLEERTFEDLSLKEQSLLDKCDPQKGDLSGVSDTREDTTEACQPDLEDRDSSPVNWDTDASEVHPPTEASSSAISTHSVENGKTKKTNSASMDDSSSTCSTDSVRSVKGHSLCGNCNQRTSIRRKNEPGKENDYQNAWIHETDSQSLDSPPDSVLVCDAGSNCDSTGPEPDFILSLKNRFQWSEEHVVKKEVVSSQRMSSQDYIDLDRPLKQSCEPADEVPSSASSPVTKSISTSTKELNSLTLAEPVPVRSSSANSPTEKSMLLLTRSPHLFPSMCQPDPQKPISTVKFPSQHDTSTKSTTTDTESSILSRPSSNPIVVGPRPTTLGIAVGKLSPSLARLASAAERLTTSADQLPSTSSGVAYQSYKSAIMDINKGKNSGIPTYTSPPYSLANAASYSSLLSSALPLSPPSSSIAATSPPSAATASFLSHSAFARECSNSAEASGCSGFTFGTVTPGKLHKPHQSILLQEEPNPFSWVDRRGALEKGGNSLFCEAYFQKDRPILDIYGSGSRRHFGFLDPQDDFPHLDIINYLLDEEHAIGKTTTASAMRQNPGHVSSRQFTFPGGSDIGMMGTVGSSFESSVGYPEDSLLHTYDSRVAPYDARREMYDMVMSPYMLQQTEQPDRFLSSNQQGQRQCSADSDNSLLRNSEMFPMPISNYANFGHGNGLNGYVAFKPANGR